MDDRVSDDVDAVAVTLPVAFVGNLRFLGVGNHGAGNGDGDWELGITMGARSMGSACSHLCQFPTQQVGFYVGIYVCISLCM